LSPVPLRRLRMRPEQAEYTAGWDLAAGGCAYAALWPGSRLFGPSADCAAAPRRTGAYLRRWAQPGLDAAPARGSFQPRCAGYILLLGSHAQAEPELVRRIVEAGHLIGNHSWSHLNLALTAASRVREELARTSETLEQIAGAPVKYFRPPFGARRPRVAPGKVSWDGSGAVERDDLRLERAFSGESISSTATRP
jgi:hypothetical protein